MSMNGAGAVEASIVEAVSKGDVREAVLLCADHYGACVGRVCLALLGNRADAEDLVQEVLLDAQRALPKWEQRGSLKGYLLAIARRKCARSLEGRRANAQKLELLDPLGHAEAADERSLLREKAERARQALAELKPTLREAIVLRYVGELRFAQIAEALGIDEPAARQRVSRGLRALQSAVSEKEIA